MYQWRDYTGSLPLDALHFNGLYVAQVYHNGFLPSTLYPQKKEAWTVYNGEKLLCDLNLTHTFYWEFTNIDRLTGDELDRLVIGGTANGSVLYIGKIYNEGEWRICKVFPPTSRRKGLKMWCRDGKIRTMNEFEILKYQWFNLD